MNLQPSQHGPFPQLLNASAGAFFQPKGSVPRLTNLLGTQRGALSTCDGSAILEWLNGAIQTNAERFSCAELFSPIGVQPYFLAIAKFATPLGAPANLSVSQSGSDSSLSGTYYYEVTAIDGVGGETTVSNEVSITITGGQNAVLVWNSVPNAAGYNIYRGTSSGQEKWIGSSAILPPQGITNTFTDTGAGGNSQSYSIGSVYAGTAGGINPVPNGYYYYITTAPNTFRVGQQVSVSGVSYNTNYPNPNGVFTIATLLNNLTFGVSGFADQSSTGGLNGTGGTASGPASGGTVSPPSSDTTTQTALYAIPYASSSIPASYSSANIVAYFPASPSLWEGRFTPSGGYPNTTSLIPQMTQFTNREVIALGNGFSPQLYYDGTGTPVNPALTGGVSVSAFSSDQVTFTATGVTASNLPAGSCVVLSSMSDSSYDGAFVVLASGSGTFTIRKPGGGSATGIFTLSTFPIYGNNQFTVSYPTWTTGVTYAVGDVIVPATQPSNASVYLYCVQGGTSGSSEPSWPNPAATGQVFPLGNISDGSVIWQEAGYLNSASPAPQGAAHVAVYEGSLWVWNTWPTDSTNGLDGPTSLRSSDPNNPLSWNPINQAFLDKDDGSEGMGLGIFTISAEGIPPEATMIAFKNYASYQVIGAFGASDFAIQRIKTERGCTAPRTIQFVPGFGVGRYTHLGVSVIDGVNDRLISEEVRPYLFQSNDSTVSDITPADPTWIAAAGATLTAAPPMYCMFIPVGTGSGGALTRALCYDLVLKAWAKQDFPFSISAVAQALFVTSAPTTVLAGFVNGTLQRWQSADASWLTGSSSAIAVSWAYRTPVTSSKNPDQRLFCQEVVLKGIGTTVGAVTCTPYVDGVAQPAITITPSPSGDFYLTFPIQATGNRFYAIFSGTGEVEIDGDDFHVVPKKLSAPLVFA